MKVIITGVTGMVGEGVLFECLNNSSVTEVLVIGRRSYKLTHSKLKELILKDFSEIGNYSDLLKNYDGCFFCAGVSSVGENEESFTKKTYDFVVPFAKSLSEINPGMTFIYVSGNRTDSTEKGKIMWARVKGRTENALMKLPFKGQYNFRPAIMKATKGQENVKRIYKIMGPLIAPFISTKTLKLSQVGKAMINAVLKGYPSQVLEVDDIIQLAK
ncbi:NAD-dependent epimerase/dehydratase family protein [Elizabethkingia ursingii]|uniref:NAD-dependent epimerase/dehydratase family protein n=1 Tax=Elizabethkingia ursingii TaxID=1756150 RepID=UPI0007517310|nr:NAD-dependent epimerase/dehydratase family protein [Elizabethkingia ursingii]KUY30312.1 nucleoside-diphosphate sugar epimerase [Elizabethkingia ursingii]